MGTISLATPPGSTDITTLSRLKEELGIVSDSDNVLLGRLITEASDLVYHILGRELYRAQWTEAMRGNSKTEILLSRYPVASIEAVSYLDSVQTLSTFAISNRRAGAIHVDSGFTTTADPIEWSVTYTAGYFLPGDDVTATTIDAVASDDGYNDSGDGFPALLRAGDTISVAGFANAANNGMKTVSTAAIGEINVGQALTDESASPSVTFQFESVGLGPFERVVTSLVSSLYLNRKRDKGLRSLKVGDVRFEWDAALREKAVAALDPFKDLG